MERQFFVSKCLLTFTAQHQETQGLTTVVLQFKVAETKLKRIIVVRNHGYRCNTRIIYCVLANLSLQENYPRFNIEKCGIKLIAISSDVFKFSDNRLTSQIAHCIMQMSVSPPLPENRCLPSTVRNIFVTLD